MTTSPNVPEQKELSKNQDTTINPHRDLINTMIAQSKFMMCRNTQSSPFEPLNFDAIDSETNQRKEAIASLHVLMLMKYSASWDKDRTIKSCILISMPEEVTCHNFIMGKMWEFAALPPDCGLLPQFMPELRGNDHMSFRALEETCYDVTDNTSDLTSLSTRLWWAQLQPRSVPVAVQRPHKVLEATQMVTAPTTSPPIWQCRDDVRSQAVQPGWRAVRHMCRLSREAAQSEHHPSRKSKSASSVSTSAYTKTDKESSIAQYSTSKKIWQL